ncbi:c-type cytochrome [Rufibacter psychrotolerans]|uniref:c-type cytochrome n=1 Tax=Rufibacter psychrotolerans TaxID=2812556 RepID=UPI001967D54F|nr:c-type cytochrome [Rufibacter sp. SYSU D00308]
MVRKTLSASLVCLFLVAGYSVANPEFGNTALAQGNKQPVKKAAAKPNTTKPTAAELEAGKQLIAKSDCMACHKIDAKSLGPSYKDVATKYPATEANYARLAQKIIKGGSGTWGQIPMAPHTALSEADAKKMTKYILSLK